jgi:hypothetical protein
VFRGDRVDGVEVGALAVERDRDDGPRARCDGRFQQLGVEIEGARIDVHVHRPGAQQRHRFGGGDIGEAWRDHLVATADAQRHLRDLQGISAVGHGDAVRHAGVGGQPLLQLAHFRAQDVLAVGQHARDARIDPIADAGLLRLEVDEVDQGVASCRCSVWPSST